MVYSITYNRGNTAKLPKLLDEGFVISTIEEFDSALEASNHHLDGFCILDVLLDERDVSAALQRLTDVLGKGVK